MRRAWTNGDSSARAPETSRGLLEVVGRGIARDQEDERADGDDRTDRHERERERVHG